jgi:BirA family biotin operon repressor/biotin-[acetyl-CoA-carboxylase] ligase
MVSVGVRPRLQATDAWQLAAAAGLALLDACREALGAAPGEGLALKWPNDVVDGQGRKLAGVLIETSIDGDIVREAVIGAGVNVNWRRADMPREIADSATSLQELHGDRLDRVALLAAYLEALDSELRPIEAGHSPVERYAVASWLTGRDVEILAGDRNVTGTVSGIGPDGSLLLQTDDGPAAFGHGEVVRVGVREASGAPA